ncbi:MAG: hypothetical protein R3277_01395 [Brumimicrobium sp.]|nr:hypothetical protein [Brumimicrobium sp.]
MQSLIKYLFLFLTSFVFAQDPFVELEIEPNTCEKGEVISITIKTNVEGNVQFELPDEFVQSGPTHSGMSSSVNYSSGRGEVVRYSFQKFSGYFSKEGEYKIGPVKIQSAKGEISSQTEMVKVRKLRNMISVDPAKNLDKAIFGIIQQSGKEIYEGQPLILEGKVYAQIDILQVESYNSFAFEGPAEVKSLQTTNHVSRSHERIAGRDVMTFKIGKSLVFPDKTGTYEISPFEIILLYDDPRKVFPERARVRSNETVVKVKPLPDGTPSSFIGAVGKFSLTASMNESKVEQGKVVELKVSISGHGNLHNIEAPKLTLPKGMILYGDPEVVDSVSFSELGAEGKKTFTYYIQANKDGRVMFEPLEIAFFDPEKKEYVIKKAAIKEIRVIPSEDFAGSPDIHKPDESSDERVLIPYISEKGSENNRYFTFQGWTTALILSSPLLLGFVFGFAFRIRKDAVAKKEMGQRTLIALKYSEEKLEKVEELNNNEEKLKLISDAFTQFLADRWGVIPGEITRGFITEKIEDKELEPETAKQILSVFNEIDELRYSFAPKNKDISELKVKCKKIMDSLKYDERS